MAYDPKYYIAIWFDLLAFISLDISYAYTSLMCTCSVFNRIVWLPILLLAYADDHDVDWSSCCHVPIICLFSQVQYFVLFSVDSYGIAILVLLYMDDHGVTWSSYGDTHRECYTEVHMHQHFNAQIHMCIPTFISIYNPTLKLSICQKFKSGGFCPNLLKLPT